VKNKVAPPFREAEFDIIYGQGISREGDLVDCGLTYNVIEKVGSWYSWGDLKLARGARTPRSSSDRTPNPPTS